MDISGAKVLGRTAQPGNETTNAGARVQVCGERSVLRRRKEHPLPKGHGENWRDQRRSGEKSIWKSFAHSQRKVRNQEIVTTNEPAYAKATARQARIDTNFRKAFASTDLKLGRSPTLNTGGHGSPLQPKRLVN